MGNIDYDRDYYGDLELPSTATVEDVKKQYRKLGKCSYYTLHYQMLAT